jgi:hypothetical protein
MWVWPSRWRCWQSPPSPSSTGSLRRPIPELLIHHGCEEHRHPHLREL